MWIERAAAGRLQEIARHFPALLLTGARQTGKTALLRRTFPHARFISLDLPSAASAAETDPDGLMGAAPGPLVLDEVQYAPGLFRHLKARIDADRHSVGRFLMTGSQKLPLMEAISDSLAGRCAIVELGTLCATELRATLGPKAPAAAELVFRGGFPELWRDRGMPAGVFHASYVATYLERDVRAVMRVGSLRDFERFLRACALRSGQLVNLADLARDVGIAGTTARDWLSVLEATCVVHLLEPWFGNVAKRMVKTPKLYLRDTGLACFLLGIESASALERSPFAGALWETFVLCQILAARAARGSAAGVFFFRDAHGTEVDFAIERGGRVRLCEAKWTESPDARAAASIRKVAELLGPRGAAEHWVACRTRHAHAVAGTRAVRAVHAMAFDGWLDD